MSPSTYDAALGLVLAHEGGYTNHSSDPGGPTNFGITIYDYRKYVKPNATAADVRAMQVSEAKKIYRTKYWDALRCDELPAGLDYAVFDYGVNSGIGRAGKVLRRLLGLPADTFTVTDAVLAAVARRERKQLIIALNDERLAFLQSLKTWPVFGNGWGARVADVKAASLRMADDPPASLRTDAAGHASAGGGAKNVRNMGATIPSCGKGVVPLNRGAQKRTAGAIAATGAIAAQQAHQLGARPAIVIAIVVLTITLAVAGWLAWRTHQQHRQQALN
jgi:lysozyme family protein